MTGDIPSFDFRQACADAAAIQLAGVSAGVDIARRESAARIAELEAALLAAKRSHYSCEDCWYSCPKSQDGCCNDAEGDECNCGADRHNAAIHAALGIA